MNDRSIIERAGDLATLAAGMESEGAHKESIAALVEAASERGAMEALHRLGLEDEHAGHDIRELRTLLEAWHDAKRTAWRSIVRWVVTLVFALVIASLALKLKLLGGS